MSMEINNNPNVGQEAAPREEVYNFKKVKVGSIFLKDDGDGKVTDKDFSGNVDDALKSIIDKYVNRAATWTRTTFNQIIQDFTSTQKESTVQYYDDNDKVVETRNYKNGKWVGGTQGNYKYNHVEEFQDGSYELSYDNGAFIDMNTIRQYNNQDKIVQNGEERYEYNDDGTTTITHHTDRVIEEINDVEVIMKKIKIMQYEVKDSTTGKLIKGRDKYGMEYTVEYKEDGNYSKKYADGSVEEYDSSGNLTSEARKVNQEKAFKKCVKLYMEENNCDKKTAEKELSATFGFFGW